VPVNPDHIDKEMFLFVYLAGAAPRGRGVKVLAKPLSSSTALSTVTDAVRQGQSFKAKIEHHSLEKRTTYLPKAFDDNQDPRAITSYEIKTT
jgi:hypothetical protein